MFPSVQDSLAGGWAILGLSIYSPEIIVYIQIANQLAHDPSTYYQIYQSPEQ